MTGKSETVTAGRETIGTIIVNDRGAEVYSTATGYLFTVPTLKQARKALFDHHQDDQRQGTA